MNHTTKKLILITPFLVIAVLAVILLISGSRESGGPSSETGEGIAYLESLSGRIPSLPAEESTSLQDATIPATENAPSTAESTDIMQTQPGDADPSLPSEGSPEATAVLPSDEGPSGDFQSEAPPAESSPSPTIPNSLYEELSRQVNAMEVVPLDDTTLAAIRGRWKNTMVVGDSMAQAVLEYSLLDSAHVSYRRGFAVGQLTEAITEACGMYPENIIFFTGLNDTDYYPEIADYISAYTAQIELIHSLLPAANVYVCSLLPPSDALGAVRPDLARAPLYDAELSVMCSNIPATYIDTNWMVTQKMYLDDQYHLRYEFYEVWLQYVDSILFSTQ